MPPSLACANASRKRGKLSVRRRPAHSVAKITSSTPLSTGTCAATHSRWNWLLLRLALSAAPRVVRPAVTARAALAKCMKEARRRGSTAALVRTGGAALRPCARRAERCSAARSLDSRLYASRNSSNEACSSWHGSHET